MLFAVLAFICVGGAIQSYAFIDDFPGVPKPPLYDLLKPLEIWPSWVFLAAPVHLLGSLLGLRWLLKYFPSLGGVSAPVASLAYAYVVSCWAVYSWSRWARYGKYGRYTPLVGVALTSVLYLPRASLPVVAALEVDPLGYAVRTVSGFALLTVVFAVYAVSIYGLHKALGTALRSHLMGDQRFGKAREGARRPRPL